MNNKTKQALEQPAQQEPVAIPREWRKVLRKLAFMARTSGGTATPDHGLIAACEEAEALLSKPYTTPPAAPVQEPDARIAELEETVRQLNRALREATEAPTFMGEPVVAAHTAKIKGFDEYGPLLEWSEHWVNFPVGTKLYTTPPAAQPASVVEQPAESEMPTDGRIMTRWVGGNPFKKGQP